MATASIATQQLVEAIAAEVAAGVEVAVESWMAQVEQALTDPELTTLGRMNAAREVIESYKALTGRRLLQCRRAC